VIGQSNLYNKIRCLISQSVCIWQPSLFRKYW